MPEIPIVLENLDTLAATANPFTPTIAAATLVGDPDSAIRRGVTWRPNTPSPTLAQLVRVPDERLRDPHPYVRTRMARHVHTPIAPWRYPGPTPTTMATGPREALQALRCPTSQGQTTNHARRC